MFVPNFKILSQVISEKSLAKTIYPLYTSYAGGINMSVYNLKASTDIILNREFILIYFDSVLVFSTGNKRFVVLELGFTRKVNSRLAYGNKTFRREY